MEREIFHEFLKARWYTSAITYKQCGIQANNLFEFKSRSLQQKILKNVNQKIRSPQQGSSSASLLQLASEHSDLISDFCKHPRDYGPGTD